LPGLLYYILCCCYYTSYDTHIKPFFTRDIKLFFEESDLFLRRFFDYEDLAMPDQQDAQRKPLRITALSVADLAKLLSAASGRQIPEELVRKIAESYDLIRADGTINLLEYTAVLARDV